MDMGPKQMVTNHYEMGQKQTSLCEFMFLFCSNEGAEAGVFKGHPSKPNGKTQSCKPA